MNADTPRFRTKTTSRSAFTRWGAGLLTLSCCALLALPASAGNRSSASSRIQVPVVDVEPRYRDVSRRIPEQVCYIEQVPHSRSRNNSHTPELIGGIIGGAIGNKVGSKKRNKQVGAVVGAILGASIANDIDRRNHQSHRGYRDQEVCNTEYRTEYDQELRGYTVLYEYQGVIHEVYSRRHPGDYLTLDVRVTPVLP